MYAPFPKNFNSEEQLLRTFWRRWFSESIPLLDNKTPVEASKTNEGRKKIEELLEFYNNSNNREGGMKLCGKFTANPPVNWVRWKLGMIEGDASQFEEEERIYNDKASIERAEQSNQPQKAVESGIKCNMCDKEGTLRCSRCKSRRYCTVKCQKLDWPAHKKYCVKVAEQTALSDEEWKKDFETKTAQEVYCKLHESVCKMAQNSEDGPKPTWKQFVQTCVKKGYPFPDYHRRPQDVPEEELTFLKDSGVHEKLWKLYFKLTEAVVAAHVHGKKKYKEEERKRIHKERKATRAALESFTTIDTTVLRDLPSLPVYLSVSWSCMMLNKATGQKECCVMAIWIHDGIKNEKIAYMHAPVLCDVKPPLDELRRALFVSMTAPGGIPPGIPTRYRPREIQISNRWGDDYYEAVAGPLSDVGILVTFQSRADLERECRREGTDPDGNNFL